MPDKPVIDYAAQNEAVAQWSRRNLQDIKNRYMRLINSAHRTGEGLDSLGVKLKQHYGVTDAISFKFNRYLVFVAKGVGRGRPIGSDKVKPKDWLQPVLNQNVPKLADMVQQIMADQAVKVIPIR